jgi:hypothetical protein
MRAERAGVRTWMLVSAAGRCQSLTYLRKNRDTAPRMLARIHDVDRNGPPANQELFRWLDGYNHRGCRVCEYKVHHPRACRAYGFQTERGWVIFRIEDKTDSERQFNQTMRSVHAAMDDFLKEGGDYE